jgi:hypothetical protein
MATAVWACHRGQTFQVVLLQQWVVGEDHSNFGKAQPCQLRQRIKQPVLINKAKVEEIIKRWSEKGKAR